MFVEDCWYVIAWPAEVADASLRRLIMNQPVVLFRCEDGSVAALEDRCSHRNFPLSKGVKQANSLQCGYHGLTFDRAGKCIYAPGQDVAPPRSDIRSYPVEEMYGVIWIWMGDAEAANIAEIPDLSWMQAKGWTPFSGGYIYLKAPDQYLAENLLDISHLAYVHKASMGSDPDLIVGNTIKVTEEPFGVRRITTMERMPTPPVYAPSALVDDLVDQRTESTMRPGLYQNHVVVKPSSAPDWSGSGADGDYPIKTRSFHGIVPETDASTHYFFGGAFMDIDVDAMNGGQAMIILSEDVDVLESVYANEQFVGGRSVINLRNDLAVMRWRTFLQERTAKTTSLKTNT